MPTCVIHCFESSRWDSLLRYSSAWPWCEHGRAHHQRPAPRPKQHGWAVGWGCSRGKELHTSNRLGENCLQSWLWCQSMVRDLFLQVFRCSGVQGPNLERCVMFLVSQLMSCSLVLHLLGVSDQSFGLVFSMSAQVAVDLVAMSLVPALLIAVVFDCRWPCLELRSLCSLVGCSLVWLSQSLQAKVWDPVAGQCEELKRPVDVSSGCRFVRCRSCCRSRVSVAMSRCACCLLVSQRSIKHALPSCLAIWVCSG